MDGFEAIANSDDRAVMAHDQVSIHQASQQRDHANTDVLGQAAPGMVVEVMRDRTTSIVCDGTVGDQPIYDELRDSALLAADSCVP